MFNDIQERATILEAGEVKTKAKLPSSFDTNYIIPEGNRNTTLFRIASRERGRGKEYYDILGLIDKINSINCKPPLAFNELRQIAKSASQFIPNAQKELALEV